jgi:hypothetical protein
MGVIRNYRRELPQAEQFSELNNDKELSRGS